MLRYLEGRRIWNRQGIEERGEGKTERSRIERNREREGRGRRDKMGIARDRKTDGWKRRDRNGEA